MRFFQLFIFFGLLVFISACVPNRKYIYLQKNDVNKQQPLDSVMREYQIRKFDYKIQTNDIISVRYFSLFDKNYNFLNQNVGGQQQISGGTTGALLLGELVDEKGEIPVPFVGKLKVGGLSIFEIQDTIQSIASKYMDAPIVKVRLLNYRVTFLGEVAKLGEHTLNYNRVSLPEAIGMAGGFTELADRSNVKIIRQKGTEATVQYVDLLSEDFLTSPYYYVHQNDIIIVPPLKQRTFKKYFMQNVSLGLSMVSVILLILTLRKK